MPNAAMPHAPQKRSVHVWSDAHYIRERRNIEKDLMPYLGKRAIGSIKPIELLAVIQKVEERGALDVAHRVHMTAHGIWGYAVATARAERDITLDILNGQAHEVPLPRQALEVLRDIQPLTGGREYVFPGLRNPSQPMSEAAISAALHAMGYKGIHTWHGYRATGRTILRQVLKYPKDIIEAQLAHTGQITHGGAYDRATHVEERTEMLQRWADYLDKLRTGAEVIQFKAA